MAKKKLQLAKVPRQMRSRQMVEDIITAAIRILEKNAGGQFTTILVAKEAGISVGSLYQYFPDKGSILFAIQSREWKENREFLTLILETPALSPFQIIEQLLARFFASEWKERNLRRSLKEALSVYKEHPSFVEASAESKDQFADYLAKSFSLSKRRSIFLSGFFISAMTALAEEASDRLSTRKEFESWTEHASAMLMIYFKSQCTKGKRSRI